MNDCSLTFNEIYAAKHVSSLQINEIMKLNIWG